MYHSIVKRIMADGFRRMGETGDGSAIASRFADDGVFAFAGTSELGGPRRGRAAVAAWFARLFELFPDLRITPLEIRPAGPPWSTVVTTRFRVDATLPDGEAYVNEGVQFARLRFGRILEDRIYEDTAALDRALARIAALRRTGAHASTG